MNEGTEDELMRATYTALCKNGYASLRMQDIADECSKSKATLHYHYESKHDLLHAFLDYLYESFVERVDALEGETPDERLVSLVDTFLTPRERDTNREFQTALLEIKAQGPYSDTYREKLERFDRTLHDRFQSIIEAGQEEGVFRSTVDADDAADFVVTVINGAQTRHVSVGHCMNRTERMLTEYIEEQLLVDESAGEVVPE